MESAGLLRHDAFLLALATALGLLLVHDLRLSVVDDVERFHLTESIVEEGRPLLPPWHGVPGVAPGLRVSRYFPLPSLAAAPLYLAARPFAPPRTGWDAERPRTVVGAAVDLVNVPVMAALVAVSYLLMRHAGADRRAGFWVAGLLPWSTFLGAEAKDPGAEPLAALCLVVSLYAARRARRKARGGYIEALLAGLVGGLAPLARAEAAVLLVGPLWLARGRTAGGDRRAGLFLAGAAPGVLAAVLYTHWRFGTFMTGYGLHGQGFDLASFPAGLAAHLFSPGRSVFVYAPTLLFLVWFLKRRWHDLPATAYAALAMGAADLLVHCAWPIWSGGFVWGPRYAFVAVALWSLVAPLGLDGSLRRRAYLVLAALGVAVNLPGLLADPATYLEVLHRAHPPWGEDLAWWDVRYHPWLGHVMLLAQGRHDLALLRLVGP